MQKIKSLFIRDEANPKLVTREIEPDCQWVIDGEGVATIKWDGSACLFRGGRLYRRHNLKEGREMPAGWLHWSFDHEQKTGHGWLLVGDSPADDYHREALMGGGVLKNGTHELVGPKIQKNPYSLTAHRFRKHGDAVLDLSKWGTGFDELSMFLADAEIEGIVWHHKDGRMAKVKRRDFGLQWPIKARAKGRAA